MITKFLRPFLKIFFKNVYCQDGLITVHNHDFLYDESFMRAYARGLKADGTDYLFQWRVHIALWAASVASSRPGDFVECGVNRGFVSSAILESLNWNGLTKRYFLFDTFQGPDERYLSNAELAAGYLERKTAASKVGFYATTLEQVQKNFGQWDNINIIKGSIPETLKNLDIEQVAFLHIDLNCSEPEVAAISYFWDLITPGGLVLLDDYAYVGFKLSKLGMDKFAAEKGVKIAALPTGQGLLIKP